MLSQNETVDVPWKYLFFWFNFFLLLRVDLGIIIIIILIVCNEWYPRVNLGFQRGPHKKKKS